ncbi:hypothetical protein HMPREF9080_02500 [Cardiobacterium valvarum F0432]|uniref:Uncharacterized protein n=1 Tax=Cardiobacterium valvarum F0432 TaxID=797473 RepID=G9ZI89_9GAMM|nr:hypothetical protein HMPREF9080_02500 [Cardiobacterium valvarum F0432]
MTYRCVERLQIERRQGDASQPVHMDTKELQYRIFPILQALSKKTPACAGVVV